MSISITQVLYAAIFLAILLVVEGIYLFVRGSDQREQAANRRMKLAKQGDAATLKPSLLRNNVLGGGVSQYLFALLPKLEHAFWAANIKTTPGKALLYCCLAFAGILFALLTLTPLPLLFKLVISAFLAFGLPLLVLQITVGRQRKAFDEQLPDAINLITRGLQAGHPVQVAFGMVSREMADPIGSQFGNAIDEINFGRDRTAALRDIAERFPNPEFLFFIAAVEMQRESGGNLVGILDNLVTVIRERSNLKKKAYAVSAEGRLTAVMVGALPYVLMAFLLLTNASFILDVVDDPNFWPLMGGAWVLWLVGMIMIWRMVNIKV